NVSVSDGALTISFTSVANNAIISAIEVISASGQMNSSDDSSHAITTEALHLQVYPNPSLGEKISFRLTGLSHQESVKVLLYDMAGRLVQSDYMEVNPLKEVDMYFKNRLDKGLYILRVSSDSMQLQSKIVIE
ncbi:T9SS type A sorting domain-containing protein, partial [Pontibacter ramchanderi]